MKLDSSAFVCNTGAWSACYLYSVWDVYLGRFPSGCHYSSVKKFLKNLLTLMHGPWSWVHFSSASALLAMQSAVIVRGIPSVCPSVCPSRSGSATRCMTGHLAADWPSVFNWRICMALPTLESCQSKLLVSAWEVTRILLSLLSYSISRWHHWFPLVPGLQNLGFGIHHKRGKVK